MADDFPRDRPHLYLRSNGETEPYRRPNQMMVPPPLPARDRAAHAAALQAAIGTALTAARQQLAQRDTAVAVGTPGFYLEVQLPANERSGIDQLANRNQNIEVVAVREPTEPGTPLFASVFVPARAENYYLDKVEAYRSRDTPTGRPKNEPMVTRIDTIRLGTVRSLFTDEDRLFPQQPNERVWWEVWLREGRREVFERISKALNIELKPHAVSFPEREVMLALSDVATLNRLVAHSDVVAELRRAKDTPAFFMGLGGAEQRAWSDDVLNRLTPPDDTNVAVCLLDSGVTRAHPLIAPALAAADCHTINPAWGVDDTAAWQGHGTRMAGVALYGDLVPVLTRYRDEAGEVKEQIGHPSQMSGMAPKCKLLSLKVLDDKGDGQASNLIAAIEAIQRINGNGRYIRVHGVNMSVGYDFEPEWFACGQSPLCVEVDRLVKSGVMVVVAAGNTGYGFAQSAARGTVSAGLGLTINDPGNADLAVTVGSTHRDMPHIYGVSYFSSKGPTGDGRGKPDLVAPGEKIVSCASAWQIEDPDGTDPAQAVAANEANMVALKQRTCSPFYGRRRNSRTRNSSPAVRPVLHLRSR